MFKSETGKFLNHYGIKVGLNVDSIIKYRKEKAEVSKYSLSACLARNFTRWQYLE